jgi:predicted Zn-dependent protease
LAQRYVEAGRLADAADVLSVAGQANPQDVPLHHFLGDIQAQLGRADEAIAAWQTAVDADPSAGNLSKLGTGLTLLGRYDEAENVLRRAQQTDPNDALVHFYLAENARKRNGSGDVELARQEYQAYLDLAPPDSPFRGVAEQALAELGR